jgi:hypothetical protein
MKIYKKYTVQEKILVEQSEKGKLKYKNVPVVRRKEILASEIVNDILNADQYIEETVFKLVNVVKMLLEMPREEVIKELAWELGTDDGFDHDGAWIAGYDWVWEFVDE